MADFITLGAFSFHARSVELGALPRTITVCANALSAEPMQVNSFTSGYMPVVIDGFLQGLETIGETAIEHLERLRSNLKTEVGKDTNTLTIDWLGLGDDETYRVFKNEDYALQFMPAVQQSAFVNFTLTLNCLP